MTIPPTPLVIRQARRSAFVGAKARMTRWAAWVWRSSRRTKLKCLNCSRPTANTCGRPFETEQIRAPGNNSNHDDDDLRSSSTTVPWRHKIFQAPALLLHVVALRGDLAAL